MWSICSQDKFVPSLHCWVSWKICWGSEKGNPKPKLIQVQWKVQCCITLEQFQPTISAFQKSATDDLQYPHKIWFLYNDRAMLSDLHQLVRCLICIWGHLLPNCIRQYGCFDINVYQDCSTNNKSLLTFARVWYRHFGFCILSFCKFTKHSKEGGRGEPKWKKRKEKSGLNWSFKHYANGIGKHCIQVFLL